jgi:hypothetical protein
MLERSARMGGREIGRAKIPPETADDAGNF